MSPQSVIPLITKEGYRAIIKEHEDELQAIIIDETLPRRRHIFKVPVILEPSCIHGSIPRNGSEWQRKNAKLVQCGGSRILYVGELGLRGGGAFHSCSSCPTYNCSSCNYYCPNGKCYDYCNHRSSHNCAQRQAAQRREREEREERERRERAERERRERVQRENEERERQERLRIQREREERIRREEEERRRREREEQERQERIRRENEERARRERLRIQREREERIRREEEERRRCEREELERQERIRRENEERERQEQLRIQREREERVRRENVEREHQEQLRIQREIINRAEEERRKREREEQERKERMQREINEQKRQEQWRIRREKDLRKVRKREQHERQERMRKENEERERQKQKRENEERERLEQLKIRTENDFREMRIREQRERQEQLRMQHEREELQTIEQKKAIKSKLHNVIVENSSNHDDELEYVSDDEVAENVFEHEYTQTLVQEGPCEQIRLKHYSESQSFTSVDELDCKTRLYETEAFFSKEFSTARYIDDISDDARSSEFHYKEVTITENDSGKLIRNVLKYLERNLTENFIRTTPEAVDSIQLQNNNVCRYDKQLVKILKRNLSKVPVALQQTILEYVFRGGKLYTRIVKRYPVFRWVEQSLIQEIVSYLDNSVDPLLLDVFRNHWFKINQVFNWEQRRELLYCLKMKQFAHKLTLVDINDVLDLVQRIGHDGLRILSNKGRWHRELKRRWLKTKVRSLDIEEEGQTLLLEAIVNVPWNVPMTERILNLIIVEKNLVGILNVLQIITANHVPSSTVLDILSMSIPASEERIEAWSREFDYYILVRNLYQLSPPIATVVITRLQNCLRKQKLLGKLLQNFVSKHKQRIEPHLATFKTVLEHIYTFQISTEIWNEVFHLLQREKNPSKWIPKVDQLIVSRIFGESREHSLEELVDQISAASIDVEYIKQNNLRESVKAIESAYNGSARLLETDVLKKYSKKPIRRWGNQEILLWAAAAKSSPSAVSEPEMVAVIQRAVECCHKFTPRMAQILSLLILLNPAENKGCLAQINTGEGKSIIVAMLAVVLALKGKRVDIVTTSTELSIPEVEKQRAFFELFDLTVAENSPSRETNSVYKCDIVYGTTNDFCGDILRSEFLGNDGRGNRKHQAVIVDEVDSMLYDSRTHSVRLADECPGMNHLEVPLAVIWEFIHNVRKHMISRNGKVFFIAEEFEVRGQAIKLYSGENWENAATVVDDTKDFMSAHCEKHLRKLLRQLTADEKAELKDYNDMHLQIMAKEVEMSRKPVDEQDDLMTESEELRRKLNELPWSKRDPIIEIPEHLRAFALTQIPSWTKNAILAAWGYTKDAQYTVINGRIVPVNFNETGVLQSNMVWSDGLTQFLQLKEGLRMDPEGISTNFISNVSFFQRYGSNIYGLTGTLGEQSTWDFLHAMYSVDMVVIPPYKQIVIDNNQNSTYRCKELAPLVFPDQKSWCESVLENALYHARNHRGVLVICKFISQARDLSTALANQYDQKKIFLYTGESTVEFSKNSIASGEIILATNIAGRGTDLKTTAQVEKHGGMCVLVTFLPESYRVEMQNVGRTAREGKRGMAQLIIRDCLNTSVEAMKALRQADEIQNNTRAIEDAKGMLIQDALFQRFCQLENRFLPSLDESRKAQQWNFLMTSWAYYSAGQLDSKKMAEKYAKWAEESKADLVTKALETLTDEQRTTMTDMDHKELRDKANEQVRKMKPDFESRYRQNVVSQFCSKQSSNFPSDLLDCFKSGQPYEPKFGETATRFNWTSHERKGAEESWGLWLKSQHLEENNVTLEHALESFEQNFERDFEVRANKNDLIRNPFYYVLKGNDNLAMKNVPQAVTCYDRAIELDPVFSVNARYNKAQALLSYASNKGEKQVEALRELRKAKDVIGTVYRPALLTFNTLIAQHACSLYTSQHVQHQLDILSQQEDFIDGAVEVIELALKNENNVKITLKDLKEILVEAKEDHEKAIREAASNGLRNLFTVEEKLPRPWKSIIAVALIGIAQIGAGCLIVACTGGALGSGLITEGVSDMISSIRSAITGTFSWAAWAAQKVISLAVSIICAGFSGIKSGLKAAKHTVKDLVGRTAVGTAQNGIELAAKEVGLAIGKGLVRECLTEASRYCTDHLFMQKLEDEISTRVGDTLTRAFLENPLVVKALQEDEQNNSNYWKQKFIKEGLKLLQDKQINECMRLIKEITKGVVSQKIPFAGDVMAISGVLQMLNKLLNYTNTFIKKFNEMVSSQEAKITEEVSTVQPSSSSLSTSTSMHQMTAQQEIISDAPKIDLDATDINVHEVTDDTSYNTKASSDAKPMLRSHYVEASTAESLANAFKRQITGNLSASIRDNLINPVLTKVSANVTNGLFANAEASVAKLRREIQTERDYRSEANDLANAKKKQPLPEKTKLGEHTKRAIAEISQEGHLHDTSSLAIAASELKAPIYVYDDLGNLKYVVGDELPGNPVAIKHFPPSDKHPLGHFAPRNSNIQVNPTGKNTCALDSVIAQLSSEQRETLKLNNANDLRERIIENIRSNPKQAEKTFEKQAALRSIAIYRILQGGAIKRVEKEAREEKKERRSVRKLNFNDPKIQEEVREVLGEEIEPDSSTMNEADRKDYQIHHLVHQKFKKHEVIKKANVDIVNHPLNKIELPRTEDERKTYGTNRSKHKGRHSNYVANQIQYKLDEVANRGKQEGWSEKDYKKAVYDIMYKERIDVRAGKDLYESPKEKTRQKDRNGEPREE